MRLPLIETPAELAETLVEAGVANAVAAGFAARMPDGKWEVSSGEACARGLSGTPRVRAASGIVFDLASVTKPMTAMAFACSGLDPQQTLAATVGEVSATASAAAPVELLLAHRAGLLAHVPLYRSLVGRGTPRTAALALAASSRRPEALGAIPPAGFDPVYSDLGYFLAGEVLARRLRAQDAGEAIENVVVDALSLRDELGTSRALGLRGVDFHDRVAPTEVVEQRGGEIRGVVHDENAWAIGGEGGEGHAGMFGTARALLAFGRAVFDAVVHGEGPLARSSGEDPRRWRGARKEELAWLVAPRPGGTLLAGFDGKSEHGSSAGEAAGPRTFGHLGFTGTSLWIDPDASALVVLLTNRVYPTRESALIRVARPQAHDALFRMAARAQTATHSPRQGR
ncbi:Beta-lactamase class C and other penicillin binding protein [Labilithrix luteola]|uniref:Beta-lactamase class C and other penicillin binding protein n=1 Tax=Labilithrix luteola TaxID=1391654 RepID=A0A0K1Q1F2_9BACT|nr:serine hydrolase domain-containing protein [Labilithrix luteola]AKU99567.1 Beta-lactamase class C and other penicillin binding protein [Labilithrix luteola]